MQRIQEENPRRTPDRTARKNIKAGDWRRGLVPSALTAVAGIVLSGLVAGLTAQRDNQQFALRFKVTAENHFLVLQNGVNGYLDKLRAVRSFLDSAANPVTRNEFDAFTHRLLPDDKAITTLSWVPRVLNSERAAHERTGVEEGLPDYHIKAMGADGVMRMSAPQNEYYPIFYATLPKTSPLYGLDLRSEPETLAEMDHARDSDRLGLSPIRTLVSSGNTKPGFLFSLPVYKRGSPHESVEDRRRNLVGFVHGSILTATMIDTILNTTTTAQGVDVMLFERGAAEDVTALYTHSSRLRTAPLQPMSYAAAAAGAWSRELTADGQPWLAVVERPLPGGPLVASHDRALIVLIFGLIVTGVLVIYIRTLARHAAYMMRANQKVSDLAQRDALTALANRRAFVKRLNEAFAACRRGAKPFAVLYFDIDHFKDVNDTLGHAVGDGLLRQVAERITARVRENDMVARFGGDEFAILQSDAEDFAAAGTLAGKIRQIMAEPFLIDGNEVHVTSSIGVAHYTAEANTPDTLMIQADLALYRAKEDGRNCFRFHSADLDRQVQERVVIAEELRGAISRDELALHYQPQVELRTGRIIGLEALLRWNHPQRGRVPPAVFIPIAERSGQIQQLGQWVLDAACRQLRSWQDQGVAPASVGVNFSALHFKASTDLDQEVAASLDRWGVAPGAIEIELTETMLMDITQQHNDRFERLRHLGVRIAIDDFGTGYSSLSYLANYPINRVKIAQELVFGVDSDNRSAAVVRAAIRLARELGIEIIAEGVETEGQAKFLLAAGCEHVQGYYFSRPVDAQRATVLLREKKVVPARGPLRLVGSSAA